MSTEPVATPAAPSALERAQRVSRSLAEAARRSRFASQGRRGSQDTLRGRRGKRFARLVTIGTFWLYVVLPTAAASMYFGLIASDQYQAEARFAVRSAGMAGADTLGSLLGVPAAQIVQNTQVVTSYIESRALLDELEKRVDLRAAFSRPEVDYLSRFNPEKPVEKLLRYWRSMASTRIEMPGGLVVLDVRAFTAADAKRIADAVIDASEELVNGLNTRSRVDSVAGAEEALRHASDTLSRARADLEVARNREGMLDPGSVATSLNTLITAIRGQQSQIQQQMDAMRGSVSDEAPQMRDLRRRFDAAASQVAELEGQLTSTTRGDALSSSLTTFATLNLQRQVAETQYTLAATNLERARMSSNTKQMYLTTFVRPVQPDEARYPRRFWSVVVVLVAGIALWGATCGMVSLVRNNMA